MTLRCTDLEASKAFALQHFVSKSQNYPSVECKHAQASPCLIRVDLGVAQGAGGPSLAAGPCKPGAGGRSTAALAFGSSGNHCRSAQAVSAVNPAPVPCPRLQSPLLSQKKVNKLSY